MIIPTFRSGYLGAETNKYVCLDCNLVIKILKNYQIEQIVECPTCSSKNKKPTEKIDPKELEERKNNIRKRIAMKVILIFKDKISETSFVLYSNNS